MISGPTPAGSPQVSAMGFTGSQGNMTGRSHPWAGDSALRLRRLGVPFARTTESAFPAREERNELPRLVGDHVLFPCNCRFAWISDGRADLAVQRLHLPHCLARPAPALQAATIEPAAFAALRHHGVGR